MRLSESTPNAVLVASPISRIEVTASLFAKMMMPSASVTKTHVGKCSRMAVVEAAWDKSECCDGLERRRSGASSAMTDLSDGTFVHPIGPNRSR